MGGVRTLSGHSQVVVSLDHLVSVCHLVPPQDTKWHKVPLSGEDTICHKVCQLVSFVMLVTMATTKMVYKPFFMLITKVVKNIGFWKLIWDNCGFHGKKIIESA